MSSAISFNLDQSKILSSGNGLTERIVTGNFPFSHNVFYRMLSSIGLTNTNTFFPYLWSTSILWRACRHSHRCNGNSPLYKYLHWNRGCWHTSQYNLKQMLLISVYLSSLPVPHLSDTPRRRLVVMGDSARIKDETTESSIWFFNMLGV